MYFYFDGLDLVRWFKCTDQNWIGFLEKCWSCDDNCVGAFCSGGGDLILRFLSAFIV